MSQKPMPHAARHRTATEIFDLAREKGYRVNKDRYERGDDHITVELPGPTGKPILVLYNTFSGRFFHSARGTALHFDSTSTDFDGQPWFDTMLSFFYVPLEEQ